MPRMRTLIRVGYAWVALFAFGGAVARCQQAVPPPAGEETEETKWLHGVFLGEMSEYAFSIDALKNQRLEMLGRPLLRYPTPSDVWGESYLWTYRGRPAVIGGAFTGKEAENRYSIFHEFHSLSPRPLFSVSGATGWHSEEPGVSFIPFPDDPQPARDATERLVQMREIAARYSACMIRADLMLDLKPSPEPFHVYELGDADSSIVGGALFAFSHVPSGDPEVILIIEAQRTDGGIRWQYAAARLTNREAWLKYKGVEVWHADAGSPGVFDGVNTKPYGVFAVKDVVREETKESRWLHEVFSKEMAEYAFHLDAEKHHKLEMLGRPFLRYPSPVDVWGESYLWTDRGRPAVIGTVFTGKERKDKYRIYHAFHSLSPRPLSGGGGATGWQPEEAGVAFGPVPGAPTPDDDAAGRLAQMRAIVGRFSSCEFLRGVLLDLKPAAEPFYRYELGGDDKDPTLVDGALFTFSHAPSGDPEVLLMIEARAADGGARWEYAPVRFTNSKAWLKYNGVEVWRAEANPVGLYDGVKTKAYGAFVVKNVVPAEDAK
jgi:hypothetical protein